MSLTGKEEDFLHLLIDIGTPRNVATVLVYLAHTPSATSRAIRCCTDLEPSEISAALQYLLRQGWIESRESKTLVRGRPIRIFVLIQPIPVIVDSIEREKMKEIENQIQVIRKLRDGMS